MTKHAEELAKLGWQYFECPACGSEGARAFPKPEQEPVAWINEHGHIDCGLDAILDPTGWTPLYTAPPQRTWVGLTDEEILHRIDTHVGVPSQKYPLDISDLISFARAIEAKLKEKNT